MKKFLGVVMLFFTVLACSVDNSDIPTLEVGRDFADSDVRVITIDTFTVELSTIKFDSIITSDTRRMLIGQYEDEFFGTVRASSFFELTASGNYELDNEAELDSVALILGYDNYYYSDTTQVSQYNLHLLQDEVRTRDDAFYNTSSLPFDTAPLTSIAFEPEPIDEDSLYIALPMSFGQRLFDLIQDNDINDDDELREEFKGLTVQPDSEDNASVIGFSLDANRTYLRLFYGVPSEFGNSEETFDFTINQLTNEPKIFNNVSSDVSGMVLDTLVDQEINLSSKASGDLSYIQAGVGYATRIQIPTIKDLYDIPGTGTLLSATLQVKAPSSSFDDLLPIRDSLQIAIINQNNVITEQVFFGELPAYGTINQNEEEFKEVLYEIPVGIYVDRELNEENIVDDAFVIFPRDFNQTVDRIVLEGENSDDFEATLVLTYAIYDEDDD
ncbi:MAG: DUF4270 family protein [Bacteroidota bacterium]